MCRAEGMAPPLQTAATPLQHVQGAARQDSSAQKKNLRHGMCFRSTQISPLGSDLRGPAAIWDSFGLWQPSDTNTVTWEHQTSTGITPHLSFYCCCLLAQG